VYLSVFPAMFIILVAKQRGMFHFETKTTT